MGTEDNREWGILTEMNRVNFTDKITTLLRLMINAGERPIIDFVKRTDEEQKRLFDKGSSKCDGKIKISPHQRGKAMDIYFVDIETNELIPPFKGFEYWHDIWCELGGNEMIEWDKGHFEVEI